MQERQVYQSAMQDIHIFIFKVRVMKGVDGSLKYSIFTALGTCSMYKSW